MVADQGRVSEAWTQWRDTYLYGATNEPTGALPTSASPTQPATPPPLRGFINRLRAIIRRIKAAPAYTQAIGENLRIVPADTAPVDDANVKPALEVVRLPNFRNLVRWSKRGYPATRLRTRRHGEEGWTDLEPRTSGQYVDDRPLRQANTPEVVSYQAIYERGDEPVGQWSDVVSATKQP